MEIPILVNMNINTLSLWVCMYLGMKVTPTHLPKASLQLSGQASPPLKTNVASKAPENAATWPQ